MELNITLCALFGKVRWSERTHVRERSEGELGPLSSPKREKKQHETVPERESRWNVHRSVRGKTIWKKKGESRKGGSRDDQPKCL